MNNKIIKCTWCKKNINFSDLTKGQKENYKKNNRAYCSTECSRKYIGKISAKTIAETNRKYASERMKKNNPMKNKASREKMRTTLRAINHKPKIRGGNGKEPTVPQKMLALSLGWDMEVAVCTKKKRNSGYPSCYKIDIANENLKIGIEVDGNSHGVLERQRQDRKKEMLLKSLGWKIIRFKNEEVLNNTDDCIIKVMDLMRND